MSTDLQPLMFRGHNVRTVILSGVLWFYLTDVCKALGISNSRDVASRLRDDMKNTVALTDGTPGNPNRVLVNERGVFKIIMRSDKPFAEEFQDAVFEYVQSIGKHGVGIEGISSDDMEAVAADPDSAVLIELLKDRAKRIALEKRIDRLERRQKSIGDLENGYVSVVGWFNMNGGTISLQDASTIGKLASDICRDEGIKIGKVKHERFGRVNSYPEKIVERAYEWFMSKKRGW